GGWEQTRAQGWKDKLLAYNAEDCAALRKVTEFVQAVSEAARSRGDGVGANQLDSTLAWADEVTTPATRREWCRAQFALQEFDHVNRCAYFDYQREKVFLRTSKAVRRACQLHSKRKKGLKL